MIQNLFSSVAGFLDEIAKKTGMSSQNTVVLFGSLITVVGFLVTIICVFISNGLANKRQKRLDFINNASNYRLKFIDLIRSHIGNYLNSIDVIIHGNEDEVEKDIRNYREKHYQMKTFLTCYAPEDQIHEENLEKIYETIMPEKLKGKDRNRTLEQLKDVLPKIEKELREIMDANYKKMLEELKGKKPRAKKKNKVEVQSLGGKEEKKAPGNPEKKTRGIKQFFSRLFGRK